MRGARTGALAEVFCQLSELFKLSVMRHVCPAGLYKGSTAFHKGGDGRICGFHPLLEETPKVGKWGSANASPLLRAFQPVTCRFPMLLWLEEVSSRPPLPKADLKCLGGICDAENVVQYAA